jgi:hypothetical protein
MLTKCCICFKTCDPTNTPFRCAQLCSSQFYRQAPMCCHVCCLSHDYANGYECTITDKLTGNDWEGGGCGLIEVLSRNLSGVSEENHKKSLVRIASFSAEIRTEHLPSTLPLRQPARRRYRICATASVVSLEKVNKILLLAHSEVVPAVVTPFCPQARVFPFHASFNKVTFRDVTRCRYAATTKFQTVQEASSQCPGLCT